MRMLAVLAATVAAFALAAAEAHGDSYPSEALANATMAAYHNTPASRCGDPNYWACPQQFPSTMGCHRNSTFSTNSLLCGGYFREKGVLWHTLEDRYCWFAYPTRVRKVREGVAEVVYVATPNCYPGWQTPAS